MLEKISRHSPKLFFPKKRPDLVDDGGGGGLYVSNASASMLGSGRLQIGRFRSIHTWSCDAVGARDWRIEYVRCILAVWLSANRCEWRCMKPVDREEGDGAAIGIVRTGTGSGTVFVV